MRSKFKWIFTLLVALTMQFSFAQEKTVSGVVSDELGPIAGANVVVEGTTRGTATDFDGKYSIKVKQGDVLVISYTSKKTAKVKIAASNSYNVTLEDDIAQLAEVEVIGVGYTKTTKEAFTGTATTVAKENLEAKTVSNVSQALRGEIAGVNVITGSGAPGSDATIRIRGFGSVNGNQAPLYVVDGAPYSSDISAINPADIETMTVLKDAAATSIYGSRGANGVILITTKQGKVGKSVISVDFKTSVNSLMLPNYDVIDSPEEYIETAWSSLKTKGALLGYLDPVAYANSNLYGSTSEAINPVYNIWNVDGSQLIDPSTGKVASGVSRRFTPTKWSDAAFGTGYRSEANVQFSGGNDKTRYSTSFGYLDDQGYAIKSNYKRYSARLNLEHKPKDWLRVGGNMAYTGARYTNSSSDEGSSGSSGNIFALTNTTPAIYDVYLRDPNGNLVADPIFGGNRYDYGAEYDPDGDGPLAPLSYGRRAWNATNGIADAKYDLSQTDATTLLGNFNFGIDITKDLTFETRYSGQYQQFDGSSRNNPFYGGWAEAFGYLGKTVSSTVNQNFLQLLRFNKSFNNHNLELFVAHESTENTYKQFSAAATKVIIPNSLDLDQYTTPYGRANSFSQRWTLDSYFSQLNYNLSQKYYLTASVRRDGSSRFINNKWGTFGSAGLGWIISKEDFMSNLSFIDFLKLKASYGVIGDQGVSLQYGWQISSIEQTPNGDYAFTESSTLANPDLTWETSKVAQFGFESTLFDGTLDVNVDYYVKNTDNLFFTQTLPPFTGYTNMQINDGQLRNSGLEFDVAAHILKAKSANELKLTVGLNGEILKNKITEMPTDVISGQKKVLDGRLSEGHSLYDWYMREWAGVDPATGAAMWNLYYNDINDNGVFDNADAPIGSMTIYMSQNPDANVKKTTTTSYSQATQKYTGKSAIPDVRGSFRLNAAYKNFDLTAQFGYSIGGYVYDNGYAQLMDNSSLIGSDNWHRDIHNAWKQYGDVTNVPRLSSGFASDVNANSTSSRFLTKADYLSLNNVRIGYNIPAAFLTKMNLSKLNLYVSGDNLLMFSRRDGLNPQTLISSSNSGIYVPMTTISFGTKIEF
ncbi:SusC/RagA family TonB-linked outer membrane protein [Flavobacterium sp. HXWNR69]|uniref:SusC/RagA family TonB-linked outer membrane protein n=1 Tax=Flavobacterium fragile TaxID=2949085 RepID=A0ABT0TE04_9FLAO|nr:SusC/RagA family TonB-linked outer membrane protein [Flavobacterium sp. HXWNR69]MCL9769127.1 SusC/RagA family TonB-linked outer membrane protein [Flavobacterium sp. HXWNR69]